MGEWLTYVTDEYNLGRKEVRERLTRAFAGVSGRRLAVMTMGDFVGLDLQHGPLLFSVFHEILTAGKLSEPKDDSREGPRVLTPIREVLDSSGPPRPIGDRSHRPQFGWLAPQQLDQADQHGPSFQTGPPQQQSDSVQPTVDGSHEEYWTCECDPAEQPISPQRPSRQPPT